MTVQSKELTQFYREYKAWLDAGAPDEIPFKRFKGLCDSLADVRYYNPTVKKELQDQFYTEGLNRTYPFGVDNFDIRMFNESQHLDPLRIKWVEDHLKPEFTGEK